MSNALAIAAVTAVLKDLLDNAMIDQSVSSSVGGPVTVSTSPPDRIKTGSDEKTQLNLFLYHVAPNSGWSNVRLPSRDSSGDRLTNPPLALDLHYLLMVYGKEDFEAEILLGYAMQVLHETPVLTREAIRNSLTSSSTVTGGILPAALGSLTASDLANQVELIKLTPNPLSTEEISKLWSAFQSNYRPTVAYKASVVLIERRLATKRSLPVLTRGQADAGVTVQPDLTPPYPTLTELEPPNNQISIRLGETLTIIGNHLSGSNIAVQFNHALLDDILEITTLTTSTDEEITLEIPDLPSDWPAGFYLVSVTVERSGESYARRTNELSLSLAPTVKSISASRDADDTITFTVTCGPEVLPEQEVSLAVGTREMPAEEHSSQTDTLTFSYNTLDAGDYYVRLRVEGVDSLLIDRSVEPPEFDTSQKVTVP